jgi:hypothetical protein
MAAWELAVSLWRHARLFRPRESNAGDWSPLEVERRWQPDPAHLQRFLDICPGWSVPGYLPPTYPQVAAADLHLRLLAAREFPWHPMGLVHLSNQIELLSALPVEGEYHLTARLAPAGVHRKGRLVSIETRLHHQGTLVWRAEAIALKLLDVHSQSAELATELPALTATRRVDLPEDLGRRYARVAGDLNPIHQRALMARLFGFRRPILHGMWTLGWATQPLVAARHGAPTRVMARFLRPVFLPGTVQLGIREEGQGVHGQLWSTTPSRPDLVFEITGGV